MNAERLHLLIVDDEVAHVEAIRRAFEATDVKIDIREMHTLKEYQQCVSTDPPDIALIDLNLPDGRVVDVLKAPAANAPFPILVMTAFGNQQIVVEVMKAGALDYVVKSPDAFANMPRIVEKAIREWELLQENKRAEVKIKAILSTAMDGFYLVDKDGRFLNTNDSYCQMIGYGREELLKMAIKDVEAVDTDEAIKKRIQQIMDIGHARFESKHRRKDGKVIFIEASVNELGHETLFVFVRDITERKQAEEALKQSEQRYRLLFNSGGDAVFVNELATGNIRPGRFIEVNDVTCARLGYSREELFQMTPADIDAPECISKIPIILEKLLADKHSVFETVHLTKDGRRIPVEVSNHLFDFTGKPAILSIVRDITERKTSEQQLRQLSRAVQQSPSAIVITDIKGSIQYVNPKFSAITGYSFNEAIGQNPRILKSGENPPEIYKALWETITSGREWRGEIRNRKKNGELFWESASISPIANENGEITHFLAVKEDITERKRMEDSLRESEELFRTMSEASPLGIIVTDENVNAIYANEAQNRICGRSLEETTGTKWQSIIHPEDRERAVGEWEEMKRTRKPFRSERRYVHKDGKTVWVSITVAPILRYQSAEAAETVRGYVGITEDITQRKLLAEQALRTQRMEIIGTLASGVAHDLNNILSPIILSADVLRAETTPDTREELILTIEECAKRGADIVQQVLTYARGSQGERARVQLAYLVRNLEKMMLQTFPKNITIKTSIPPGLWQVTGDQTQIHQILLNLCINARDAMPGGGSLRICGENKVIDENFAAMIQDAKAGDFVLLTITDSGSGISHEIIDKIFDPFFTTKEIGKGTGLGLSTVLGIVRTHGGFVTVESKNGKGSTFKVFLPRETGGTPGQAHMPQKELPQGGGMTVLLVDDEASIVHITSSVLEKNSYKVLTATDGVEALALYVEHANEINLVLTDVMMPGMDGLTLIRALKEINPQLKIVASTGQATDSHEAQLRQLGVKVILRKPYNTRKLLDGLVA